MAMEKTSSKETIATQKGDVLKVTLALNGKVVEGVESDGVIILVRIVDKEGRPGINIIGGGAFNHQFFDNAKEALEKLRADKLTPLTPELHMLKGSLQGLEGNVFRGNKSIQEMILETARKDKRFDSTKEMFGEEGFEVMLKGAMKSMLGEDIPGIKSAGMPFPNGKGSMGVAMVDPNQFSGEIEETFIGGWDRSIEKIYPKGHPLAPNEPYTEDEAITKLGLDPEKVDD